MIGGPHDPFITGRLLHFGRLIITGPHATQPSLTASSNLEAIAVNAFDRGIACHQEIAVVDVTYNHACLVDEVKRTRHILRCPHKEPPVGLRKLPEPQLRNVKIEDRSVSLILGIRKPTIFPSCSVSVGHAEAMQPSIGDS
jgi:hypothetical protein